MRLTVHKCKVFVFLIVINCSVQAQVFKQVLLSKFTQQQGLSSFNIHKIVQDPFGFVWIATQDGLNRFDGRGFTEYNKNSKHNKHPIIAPDCRDLFIDTANSLLWVLANEGGLNAINYRTGRVEKTIYRKSNNPDDWAISFEYANDQLWIGTGNGLCVFNMKTGRFLKSPLDPLLKGLNSAKSQVRLCKRDRFNNIWACINGLGIAIIDGSSNSLLKLIPVAALNDISRTGVIQFFSGEEINNQFVFGTNQGLRTCSFDKDYTITINNSPCHSLPVLNKIPINWVAKGAGDNIYVSADKFISFTGLFNNPVIFYDLPNANSDWFSGVANGLCINNNMLLLGCKEGLGIMKLSDPAIESVSNSPWFNQKLNHVYALWPLTDDSILVAANSGLHLITQKTSITTIRQDCFFQNISPLPGNKVLISNPQGLQTLVNNRLLPISALYRELTPYQHWEVNSCVPFNDSILILGTENFNGILIWNTKKKTVTNINQRSKPLGLQADIVNTVYKDRMHRAWVLSDKTITIIDPTIQTAAGIQFTDSTSGLPVGLYFDMCEANGYYWIAAYGTGIIQMDARFTIKRILTVRDGLSNNGVYKIFNHKGAQLYITTNNGLSILDLENYGFTNYYQTEGLHSNSFEEACGVYKNNNLYVGGLNGFSIIHPEMIVKNKTPPLLYFNTIETETANGTIDTTDLGLKEITIPDNYLQTKIYFSALNYYNPSRTTFRYKINNLHSDWINIGTQNFVTLIGLAPGNYTLQLQAFNEDGAPSAIRELTLVFLPKWHQTRVFKLVLLLLAIGIVYTAYRIRINQLRKEHQIRTRLASDLHDDLGSTMNSVKIYANLAIMEHGKYLNKVKEGTQEAITSIKDIIWVLDDKKDTIEDLHARISTFAIPLCEANNIAYKQLITDDCRYYKLGQEERRNLYMILKETINNGIKYADCKKLELIITLKKTKPEIIIKDDGNGFETEKVVEGNGLKNMTRRAKEIKYHIQITSTPGTGTTIHLHKI